MQPERTTFLGFLGRTLWPLLLLVLFLSIGINAFFLTVERFQRGEPSSSNAASDADGGNIEPLTRGPKAFGNVDRRITVRLQKERNGTALLPVGQYALPAGALPDLPSVLPLYRDQGADLLGTDIAILAEKMGLPDGRLFTEQTFFVRALLLRSADRATEFAVDAERRLLTVKRRTAPPDQALPPADNAEARAIATKFAAEIGIDSSSLGEPVILSGSTVGGKPALVGIVWHARFAGHPLYDQDLKRIAALSVEVDRSAHSVSAATLSLLRSEFLASSDYPVSPRETVLRSLEDGGILPVPKSVGAPSSDSGKTLAFDHVELIYVALPATAETPSYVVPAALASGLAPASCKGCAPVRIATYVPVIDEEWFKWR